MNFVAHLWAEHVAPPELEFHFFRGAISISSLRDCDKRACTAT